MEVEKDRVLIVAKTRMQQGICVSALSRSGNKGLRLRTSNGSSQPENTPFEIGQVWDIVYRRSDRIVPPHVEDVCVLKQYCVGKQTRLREVLLQRIQPWQGGPEALFSGLLEIRNMTAYIGHEKGLPPASTGYWLPDRPLNLVYRRDKPYYWLSYTPDEQNGAEQGTGLPDNQTSKRRLYIRFVGLAHPLTQIVPQTLLRVSLARWWVPPEIDEERCYLQLSGWYLDEPRSQAPVAAGSINAVLVG